MQNQHTGPNAEVDLNAIAMQLKRYGTKVNDSFFDLILFFKRNALLFGIVIIAGGVLGYLSDNGEKSFESKIVVTPNFGSTEYLYTTVDLIQSKIYEHDSLFFKKVGIKVPSKFTQIKIAPVVDIFGYVEDLQEDKLNNRLDVLKIMVDNGQVDKILEDKNISRNYRDHVITVSTRGKSNSDNITKAILDYINSSAYFNEIAVEQRKSLDAKIVKNDEMISQIDAIVSGFSTGRTSQGSVYYNDNTQVNDLINIKNNLVREQGRNIVKKVLYTKVVKDKAALLNIKKSGNISGNAKFIYPFLLVILTTFLLMLRRYYKKQVLKRQVATA